MKRLSKWIPFIGFRQCYVDLDGYPVENRSGYIADTFEVEWLNQGMIFLTFNYRRGHL